MQQATLSLTNFYESILPSAGQKVLAQGGLNITVAGKRGEDAEDR